MATISYQGLKITSGGEQEVFDNLSEESALEIAINGDVFSITMRTPGDDDDLVRGLLFLENIYTGANSLVNTPHKNKNSVLDIYNVVLNKDQIAQGYSSSRNLLSVSSCGICGKTTLENIKGKETLLVKEKISLDNIKTMYKTFRSKQQSFELTGGCHAAAAFNLDGKMLVLKEDIGRHNAVDKVVGNLLNSNKLSEAKILLLSGRISYELIAKAFKAKIPVVAAISAPSSLAVDFAKELGITILGFCREDRATCYANPQRIKRND